ncbi:hypothetical protein LXL04_032188 [Taraxacum kok-saghyz]
MMQYDMVRYLSLGTAVRNLACFLVAESKSGPATSNMAAFKPPPPGFTFSLVVSKCLKSLVVHLWCISRSPDQNPEKGLNTLMRKKGLKKRRKWRLVDPEWYTRILDLRLTVRILSIVINVPKDSFNSGTNTGIKLLTTVEDSSPRKIPRISENQFNVQQLSEDPE